MYEPAAFTFRDAEATKEEQFFCAVLRGDAPVARAVAPSAKKARKRAEIIAAALNASNASVP